MQIASLKYDIISWVTGLKDEKLIHKLHQWAVQQETPVFYAEGIVPPRRKGSLTEGYGFWENMTSGEGTMNNEKTKTH